MPEEACTCSPVRVTTSRVGTNIDVVDDRGRWHAVKAADNTIYRQYLVTPLGDFATALTARAAANAAEETARLAKESTRATLRSKAAAGTLTDADVKEAVKQLLG